MDSEAQIKATFNLPASASGKWDLTVKVGENEAKKEGVYTVEADIPPNPNPAPLSIKSFNPTEGKTSGKDLIITAKGTGFTANSRLTLISDGERVESTNPEMVSNTEIKGTFDLRGQAGQSKCHLEVVDGTETSKGVGTFVIND